VSRRRSGAEGAGLASGFPVGAAVTMGDLDGELHAVLARLRESEPVSWLPVLGGWLVTSRDMALRVLRDSATFTVDDPRFSTARVIGPSMLSLDGAEHKRHRDPFAEAFRRAGTGGLTDQGPMGRFVEAEAGRLVAALAPAGRAELRRGLAGPLAVAVVAQALGLGNTDPAQVLAWYDEIVGAVSALAGESGQVARADPEQDAGSVAGRAARAAAAPGANPPAGGSKAFRLLSDRLRQVISGHGGSLLAAAAAAGGLTSGEVVSNAAVVLFGGIETTEGMICNAAVYLLDHPAEFRAVLADRRLVAGAVEESLRMEPAAAVVDRYATRDLPLAGAQIRRGDLVTVSLAGAGRDPAFFPDPDRFDVRRQNASQHLAFAHGPHFCLGAGLARLEATAALAALLELPGLRLDPPRRDGPRGVVFRKPPALHVLWDAGAIPPGARARLS
jgi:cytochrome P450